MHSQAVDAIDIAGADGGRERDIGEGGCCIHGLDLLVVRRRECAVSNQEAKVSLILRDARKSALLSG
jgi:hypothetical protein